MSVVENTVELSWGPYACFLLSLLNPKNHMDVYQISNSDCLLKFVSPPHANNLFWYSQLTIVGKTFNPSSIAISILPLTHFHIPNTISFAAKTTTSEPLVVPTIHTPESVFTARQANGMCRHLVLPVVGSCAVSVLAGVFTVICAWLIAIAFYSRMVKVCCVLEW